jgi:hypothetical protein
MHDYPLPRHSYDGHPLSGLSFDRWIEQHYEGWIDLPDDREFARLDDTHVH